jgi:hypothetical protein
MRFNIVISSSLAVAFASLVSFDRLIAIDIGLIILANYTLITTDSISDAGGNGKNIFVLENFSFEEFFAESRSLATFEEIGVNTNVALYLMIPF